MSANHRYDGGNTTDVRNPEDVQVSARSFQAQVAKAAAWIQARDRALDEGTAEFGPYLAPCAPPCGAGLHEHAGPTHKGGCKRTGCARYRADVIDQLVQNALVGERTKYNDLIMEDEARERARSPRRPRQPGEWRVGPSDLKACRRKLAYKNGLAPDLIPDPEFRGEARAGTVIEQDHAARMAEHFPWRLFQLRVRVKGLDSDGIVDDYDPITGRVNDDKSCGSAKWDRIADGAEAKDKGQVHLYATTLEEMGYHVASVSITYINRTNYREEVYTWLWDDAARAYAEEARSELLGYLAVLDTAALTGTLPERDEPGPSTSELCRRCFARSHCWSLSRAAALGMSPEAYTQFGAIDKRETMTPQQVQDVEWAIKENVRLRNLANEAKKAYEGVQPLVDGVPPGVYGDGQITRGRPGSTDYKTWTKQLIEAAEQGVTDLSLLPVPKYGPTRNSAVLRRASQREPAERPVGPHAARDGAAGVA